MALLLLSLQLVDRVFLARGLALLGALALPAATPLAAQGGRLDVAYGWWWHDATSTMFTASYQHPLVGPFGYGLGIFHLNDSQSQADRTMTGGEVSLMLGGARGVYGVGSVALGIRHVDSNFDALWSLGAGYRLRLFSVLSLGADVRYRVQDQSVGGFWRLDPTDRKGFSLQAFIALDTPRGGSPSGGGRTEPPTFDPPSLSTLEEASYDNGVSSESAELAVAVVQTALDAMGSPYQWGGTDENGYDCSGLIHYAYGEHGILLPRVSRDQTRTGRLLAKDVSALRPGDILGFSTNGGGVSHVGLYVGDGTFIHSASSGGVKLSSLTATDAESRWWRDRWIVGRRVLN